MNSKPQSPPALDAASAPSRTGSRYPAPFTAEVAAREKRALGDLFGLTNFGVNHVRLPAGTMSSQRHWHAKQDEFVYVLEGELILITDDGEQVLTAGMVAGFPAGAENGHHLVNRSAADAVYLEVGDRMPGDQGEYPDIDMRFIDGAADEFVHKDGTPY